MGLSAVMLTLFLLRHNNSQDVAGELFGCSQASVSRLFTVLYPLLGVVNAELVARVKAQASGEPLLVDGFIAPTGERPHAEANMFSDKHHECGFNVQVMANTDREGDGRLFTARDARQGPGSLGTYTRAFRQACKAALTPAQQRSPLAQVPYRLRHAAVSTWLNAGVPATQVAEWAGHGVQVLLKVYAKCIDGEEEVALRRIPAALGIADGEVGTA
jgi:hypothetical protein